MMKSVLQAVAGIAVVSLSGCANTGADYLPIVDGPKNTSYNFDVNECSALASQRAYTNDDVKSEALLGGGIGAIAGGAEEGIEGAVAGVLIGSFLGGADRAWKTRDERKNIVIECMKQRGHRVIG